MRLRGKPGPARSHACSSRGQHAQQQRDEHRQASPPLVCVTVQASVLSQKSGKSHKNKKKVCKSKQRAGFNHKESHQWDSVITFGSEQTFLFFKKALWTPNPTCRLTRWIRHNTETTGTHTTQQHTHTHTPTHPHMLPLAASCACVKLLAQQRLGGSGCERGAPQPGERCERQTSKQHLKTDDSLQKRS